MPDTRLTDERLRRWLDANQVQRERMCAQLLPLMGEYTHVEPRRPNGGPDGARDLQARYRDEVEAWGAVGFRNSASDDPDDRRWVATKFKDDLKSATDEFAGLSAFVFFTNVDLTPAEVESLKSHAKGLGIGHVEIFIRERLRLVLDSIEGWGYRLQFLDITMTREEQLAFIERYGARLESLFAQQQSELRQKQEDIDAKLQRIEFLQDSIKPARKGQVFVALRRPLLPEELGHFRILLRARSFEESPNHPTIWFAGRDSYPILNKGEQEIPLFGVRSIVWSENPNEKLQDTLVSNGSRLSQEIRVFGFLKRGPFRTLADFDRLTVDVFVTSALVPHIAYLGFSVNNYILVGVPGEALSTRRDLLGEQNVYSVEWPEELNPEEQQVEWTALIIKGPDAGVPVDLAHPPFRYRRITPWNFDFEAFTPVKLDRTPD